MQYVKLQVWTRRNRVAIRHRPPHRNSVPESRWVLGISRSRKVKPQPRDTRLQSRLGESNPRPTHYERVQWFTAHNGWFKRTVAEAAGWER